MPPNEAATRMPFAAPWRFWWLLMAASLIKGAIVGLLMVTTHRGGSQPLDRISRSLGLSAGLVKRLDPRTLWCRPPTVSGDPGVCPVLDGVLMTIEMEVFSKRGPSLGYGLVGLGIHRNRPINPTPLPSLNVDWREA